MNTNIYIMDIQKRIKEIEANNRGKTIHGILEKYWFQRRGVTPISGEPWAESEEQRRHYKEHFDWENDGKPTGIIDDAEFYTIQRAVYEKVIYFVDNEKLDYKSIASQLYDYLKTLPNGTEISTHEAVDKILGKPQVQYTDYSGYIYFYGGTVIEEDNFWDIHNSLMGKIAMGHKYDTDFSKYENQHVGLPYNIPFVFKLKNK